MDKQQAKFILRSFRPGEDGMKAEDFAQALALAASNRDLGEWLAEERAMDETFAKALASIELPETLREDIVGCLDGERHDYPNAEDSQDAAMIGALAAVPVPRKLRGDIITAMERSAPSHPKTDRLTTTDKPSAVAAAWKHLAMPLAAAAGIALALIVTRGARNDVQLAQSKPLPIEVVPVSFIQSFEAPDFALEVKRDDREQLVEVLHSRSLPCPCCLPPGLENSLSIGCRELVIHGKKGSLVCFQEDNMGVVHLIIFNRKDVDGSCANKLADPCILQEGQWSVARWQNDESVFFLIGQCDQQQMQKLF